MPVLSQSGEGVSVSRVESGSFQNRLRPILPCKYVERPKEGGVVNRCVLGKEAIYVAR